MKKSILVTGATSGIGRAATELFASHGYLVFATYRKADDGAALASIENVHPIRMDVTNADDVTRAASEVAARVGPDGLYAVLNNAGIAYAAPFEFADEERGREVMEVNVMAPFRIAQKFLPLLKLHNAKNDVKARIVNISSWAGTLGQPFIPFYNASKFAITGLTESMFYDLGLLDVHVVLASPGTTKTPLLGKTTRAGTESLDQMTPEGRARYQPLLDHYATLSVEYGSSPLFQTPEQAAKKLLRIVDTKRPRFRYDLSTDAWMVNRFIARFVPWTLKVAMNRSMFRLSKGKARMLSAPQPSVV
jgi:NAD(P)-dependent dehydrogenase (short-subunit alcohol dehydrogenase family)